MIVKKIILDKILIYLYIIKKKKAYRKWNHSILSRLLGIYLLKIIFFSRLLKTIKPNIAKSVKNVANFMIIIARGLTIVLEQGFII